MLTASGGCDSTVTTYLTVNARLTSSQTVTLCAGQQLTVGIISILLPELILMP